MCGGSIGVVTSWHSALLAVLRKNIRVLLHRESDVDKTLQSICVRRGNDGEKQQTQMIRNV